MPVAAQIDAELTGLLTERERRTVMRALQRIHDRFTAAEEEEGDEHQAG